MKCKQCGAKTKRLYCSDRCKWTWHNHNRTLSPNVEYDCEICGTHVSKYMTPSEIKRDNVSNRFCSRKCAGVWRRGKNHPAWGGGRHIDKDGYVLVMCPGHIHANGSGYVREHRLVMESHLGRTLTKREVVDHKNGNTSDNRIDNLQLFKSQAEHMRHHANNRKRTAIGTFKRKRKR